MKLKMYIYIFGVLLTPVIPTFFQLRALHEQGYSLQSVNKNGQTALHFACKYNHRSKLLETVGLLAVRLNLAELRLENH